MANLRTALQLQFHFTGWTGILVSSSRSNRLLFQTTTITFQAMVIPRLPCKMTIVRNKLRFCNAVPVKISGLTIDGIKHDYVKVRYTPFVIRYGKDGSYESVIFSLVVNLDCFFTAHDPAGKLEVRVDCLERSQRQSRSSPAIFVLR